MATHSSTPWTRRVASAFLIVLQFAPPVVSDATLATYGPVTVGTASTCTKPVTRVEWRTLSATSQKSYISAVKCLMSKPPLTPKSDIPGVSNRYEDFLGTHILQQTSIHFVGKFYPWHRLLVVVYEKMLQDCGYTGTQPYWDWSLDVGDNSKFPNSPIFDPTTGFGGNGAFIPGNFTNPAPGVSVTSPFDIPGRTGGGCIPNGPFVNWKPNIGPGPNVNPNPHCVRRDLSPLWFNNNTNPATIAAGQVQSTFGWLDRISEYTVHGGGHFAIGGIYGAMSDLYSSPSDPLFYLHHANIDRYWWSWQSKNLPARLSDMSGPLVQFDYGNQQGGNATLDTEIRVGQSVNITLKIRDVMNIQGNVLCYKYDKLY